MSDVGSRRVYEDERVIVWHFDLQPGEECPLHTHELDYVARIVSGSTVEVLDGQQETLYTVDRQPGDAITFRVAGDQVMSNYPGAVPIPATHRVRNVGNGTFQEVIIEFKK